MRKEKIRLTLDDLDKNLGKSIDALKGEIDSQYSESSNTPATSKDINALAQQILTTFVEFKQSIIEYLE